MLKNQPKIAIIGAGPAGIGAAYHLDKLGYKNWIVYEKNDHVGGQSASFIDPQGFLWDQGGHVLHSHYKYYDDFISAMLGQNFYLHQRESWIKHPSGWVPYPFQNNLKYLSREDQLKCLLDLLDAQTNNPKVRAAHFKDWVLQIFGQGIADIFMYPYNFHIWATPIHKMDHNWIADRVSLIDFKRVLSNVILDREDNSWGPNNKFIFPKYRGTGEIYSQAGKLLKDKIIFNKEVKRLDPKNKAVTFKDNTSDNYDYLINTIPLDQLIKSIGSTSAAVKTAAQKLYFNNVLIIGLGLIKPIKTTKCWTYFVPDSAPFYRLTFFHNYSPYNVPENNNKKYSSLMCEVSYSKHKKINRDTIIKDCINALIKNEIINKTDRPNIISKSLYDIKYAYPVPTIDRDKNLKKIQPWLLKNNIYSRGRFGAWKYEIGNMDHCFMQGVEAVDNILHNKPESTWTL